MSVQSREGPGLAYERDLVCNTFLHKYNNEKKALLFFFLCFHQMSFFFLCRNLTQQQHIHTHTRVMR